MSEAVAAPFGRLLSDERLTQRAVGGDERAFAAIFRRYHQSLFRFCLAIVGNPDDASEALQNTMIKVLRALPGEEREIDLKPWLYRIAHNESIDLLRRRRETRQLDVEQVAPGYGLAEDAAARERLRRLITDLKNLPERQREVLVMRELAGLGFKEIGTALGTSGAVARQTLYEARQSLRQMEEGREMSCAIVTKALSDGDGRVTRRRDVRAHLRSCAYCQGFSEEIKSRQRDLAALSPLPAMAAAGMLQGLIGGSSGAGSGGIAATLGGGAAKTIGASAAAKGVATVAVVAAIGVTAADRSGVIHLGLPGEQTTKSAEPGSGSPAASPAPPTGGSKGNAKSAAPGARVRADGRAAVGRGSDGTADRAEAAPAAGAGDGHAVVPAHDHGRRPPHEEVSAEAQGPLIEQPHGEDHEEQDPEAATEGQETATEGQETATSHKPPPREIDRGNGAGDDHAATPVKPSHPPTPTPPSHLSPPKAAAEPPTPAQSQGSEQAAAAAGASRGGGSPAEKGA
jgi:RNA polymerase sigma factor (sigma-70 family)